jgi:hypothetical protein
MTQLETDGAGSDLEAKELKEQIIGVLKLSHDSMKHLTTLCTGSLLLMIALMDKLSANSREWRGLIGVALVCFLFSIICAMS